MPCGCDDKGLAMPASNAFGQRVDIRIFHQIQMLIHHYRDYRVTRHAGPDPASSFFCDLKSFWIPAFAGMTVEKH